MEGNNGLCSKGFRSCFFSNGTRLSTQPEYGYSLKIREKRDVHSYGVVVLEVLTGKQPIDPTIQDGLHIIDWVKKMRDIQVIDKGLLARPECDVQEMMQTLGVALLCVNTHKA
ncbi:hypothetical protein YC2023_085852 [Brassica napus]